MTNWLQSLQGLLDKFSLKGLIQVHIGAKNYDFRGAKNINLIADPTGSNIIEKNSAGDQVTINTSLFPEKDKDEFGIIIRKALEETGYVMERSALEQIQDVQKNETQTDIHNTLAYFEQILPAKDIIMFRTCLYLKSIHEKNDKNRATEVRSLKIQIGQSFGKRGSNMANLCSARYFDTWFKPLYENLIKIEGKGEIAKEKFLKIYNVSIDEQPWTIFVHQQMSEEELLAKIIYKLKKIQAYGSDFVNVHALSSLNTKKVRDIIPGIEKEFPDIITTVTEEGGSIIVKFRIRSEKQSPS